MTPSICGSFLVDKRSLVAFTWTITTVMTLVAFVLAVAMMIQVHTHYKHMERYYEQQWYDYQQNYNSNRYNNNNNQNNNNQQGGEGQQQQQAGSRDEEALNEYKSEIQTFLQLSQISSNSMTFVAVYTMSLAVALCIYGSTAIVGFTSLRGVYIAPCFSTQEGSAKLRLGIFGGAVVFFANVLLVAAVVLGEVRVRVFSACSFVVYNPKASFYCH
jgi:ABC-type multidrug transport system fused ATPase/permease subunit